MKVEFEATEEVAKILEDLVDKDKYINVAVQLLNEAVITERKKAALLNPLSVMQRLLK